ncbi:MAG: hypothetical protein EOP56_09225 [Sphingobacteriales bacterium]|nr:MAG: hypothetical protein EOP56_09225 [Sphingobacteriales bacterium]
MPVEFKATTDAAGRLIMPPEEKARLAKWAAENPCKEVVMAVAVVEDRRSLQQNAYYWDVVIPAMQIGYERTGVKLRKKEEVHAQLKQDFNYDASTADLSKKEFWDYMEIMAQYAAEYMRIEIKLPNQERNKQLK